MIACQLKLQRAFCFNALLGSSFSIQLNRLPLPDRRSNNAPGLCKGNRLPHSKSDVFVLKRNPAQAQETGICPRSFWQTRQLPRMTCRTTADIVVLCCVTRHTFLWRAGRFCGEMRGVKTDDCLILISVLIYLWLLSFCVTTPVSPVVEMFWMWRWHNNTTYQAHLIFYVTWKCHKESSGAVMIS